MRQMRGNVEKLCDQGFDFLEAIEAYMQQQSLSDDLENSTEIFHQTYLVLARRHPDLAPVADNDNVGGHQRESVAAESVADVELMRRVFAVLV